MASPAPAAAIVHHPHPPARRRVLVVDDSAVIRAVLARVIEASGDFTVAAAVTNVAAALSALATARVDVILLDLQLPGIDGLTALPDLLSAGRGAKVLVVSATTGSGAAATVQALALGAADTLAKPAAGAFSMRFGAELLDRLRRLTTADAEPDRDAPTDGGASAVPTRLPMLSALDVIAIGASTGGIHAIGALLRTLPPAMTTPILVTQHLPPAFMPYFAAQLAVIAGRPSEVATHRSRLRPGRILVAPGDAHLGCVGLPGGGAAVRLSAEPAGCGCLPSVDVMLAACAETFGARCAAVVLSGMGRDGAVGAGAVKAAGGHVLVQDRASSAIWGMPGSVAAAGHADAVLPPAAIGAVLARSAA